MANTTMKTRITNKYDLFADWMNNDPVLLKGEIAIAEVPSNATLPDGVHSTPPVMLVKVGDGTKKYSELDFISAKSADVYAWAKAATKPTYEAKEITGVMEYQLVQNGDAGFKLQSRQAGTTGSWTDVSTIDVTIPTYTLETGSANGTVAFNGTDVAVKGLGTAAYTDADAYDAVGSAKAVQGDTTGTVKSVEDSVAAIKDGTTMDSFADVEADLADKATAISAAQDAADKAQGDVDTLKDYVGTFTPVADETTVVGYVDAKINAIPAQTDYTVTVAESTPEGMAKAYTFSQLGKEIATINIPKDMVVESGSVVTDPEGQPAGTYIKLVLANATNDTLFINVGDLIEYVTGGTAADGMITVTVDSNHVVTAIINDGTVTLAKLHTDVQTQINKAHTHDNKDLLDTYTQTETDLADAVSKKHNHANAAELDKIADGDVAKWNVAEQNAKDYADDVAAQALADAKSQVTTEIEKLDVEDNAVAGQVVSAVSETDGKISVTRRALVADDIPTIGAEKITGLSNIATTGNVNDLVQTDGDYIIFDCGSSSTVI